MKRKYIYQSNRRISSNRSRLDFKKHCMIHFCKDQDVEMGKLYQGSEEAFVGFLFSFNDIVQYDYEETRIQ